MTVASAAPLRSTARASRTTLAIGRFLDHCRVAKRLSVNTLRAYECDLTDFLSYVGRNTVVTGIDREKVRSYARALLDERDLRETTVKRRLATLRVLFRWMEREELVPLSVFHRLDLSIRLPRRLPRTLEPAEMSRLLQRTEVESRAHRGVGKYEALLMHFVVVALFTTGLRIGELVAVRLPDLGAVDGSIAIRGKGNRERRVYIPGRQALRVLSRYLGARRHINTQTDCLLVSGDGTCITAQRIRKRMREVAGRAGIRRSITPHMLRHTAATQLLEAGVDIRFVQRLLGHTSILTTQLYTEVRDVTLQAKLERANTLSRLRAFS